MVRKTTRRGKRVWVIDIEYTKPDGTKGRYRRDAKVQTSTSANAEDAARKMGATLYRDPEQLCGADGKPLAEPGSTPEPNAVEEPTFAEVVKRYHGEYAPSALTPATHDDYAKRLSLRVLPRFGELRVSEAFDVARARALDVAMIAEQVGISTRRNTLLALRSVAKFAVEAKILTIKPDFLPLPKRGKRVPTAPPPGDVAMVIDAASSLEHRLVILLAAHAGLRQGEIRALRCGDVEFHRNRLIVRLSRYKHHTGQTKSGHEREVPLSPQLRAALLAASVDMRGADEHVARNAYGKPWGNHGPYDVFQKTLARINLPKARLHALRAFFVTTLLNGHVPAHVVRELVGHGDLATTQMYAAIVTEDRGAAVGVLDRVYQDARVPTDLTVGADRATSTVKALTVRRRRPLRRLHQPTGRIRALRRRVRRRRSSGNSVETAPMAAE